MLVSQFYIIQEVIHHLSFAQDLNTQIEITSTLKLLVNTARED
jgi:hypothetical protein